MMSTAADSPHKEPSSGWIKLISNEEVRRVLVWEAVMPAVRRALIAYTHGPDHPSGAIQPLRSCMNVPQRQGFLLAMPGVVNDDSMAVKIVTHFPSDNKDSKSTISAQVLLLNKDTGLPAALLQGEAITEIRTAAASAVATQELLRGKEELGNGGLTVAVLGAGKQAVAHSRVMAHILTVKKVIVWARRMEAAEALCAVLCSEGIPASAAATVQEAVKDAHVINSCTSTATPILKAEWVKPGAHINSVGAPRPSMQEMEEDLVKAATIYTDSYEAAYKESGDIIKSGATIYAEMGEVLLGKKPVLNDKITIFKSLGLAIEDAVSAQLVYNQVMKLENQ